ncbi:MAG: alkaline phosphatase family protein [Chloroflexi bacterium]|nr:alkaline phosphatase family protein [Chloroflexota bacterium]
MLVIGLDGATFDLLKPWMAEGRLPNLKRLMDTGASGELQSTLPPLTAAAWVSFATGVNPGKHGLFDFVFPRSGSYDVLVANPKLRDAEPMWRIASQHGKQVAIVSVPMTYPPEPVNGIMLSCFMTPSDASEYSYPRALKRELIAQGFKFETAISEKHRSGDIQRFLDEVALSTKHRVETVLHLMRTKRWDLFTFVFQSTDLLQHELWRLIDPTHPRHSDDETAQYLDLWKGYYDQLDAYLGELIETAGRDTNVIVMSDHGFGRVTHLFYVNNWLLENGYMALKPGAWHRLKLLSFKLGWTPMNVFKLLTYLHLAWLRQGFRFGQKYGAAKHLFFSFEDIDWSRTRAFSFGNFGQIYINLKGRQQRGIVERGAEYEQLLDEITRGLLAYVDPLTGKQFIERVIRKDEIYAGQHFDDAPDLTALSNDLEYVAFGTTDFGSNRVTGRIFGMTGYHRMNGIFTANGPDVKPNATVHDAAIIDLAPTILHALGVPVPDEMDGRVLYEIFKDEALREPELANVRERGLASHDNGDGAYTDEEEELVQERLRELGYLA